MRYKAIPLALLLVPAMACGFNDDGSSTSATVRVGEAVALAVGQTALVEETGITITFVAVLSDSRCPSDAVCILLGDAKMRLRADVSGVPAAQADVGLFDHTSLTYQGLEFTVENLDPWPKSTDGTPPQSSYRATIRARAVLSNH